MGSSLLRLFPAADFSLIALMLGLPLLGAFVNGIWGHRLGKPAVRLMALVAVGASFIASLLAFVALHHLSNEGVNPEHPVHEHVKLAWTAWSWMHTNGGPGGTTIPIDIRFSIDALSAVMILVVTGVGFLIHLYATSYMEKDKSYARFFAYMNLFIFSMLVLVLADNLPVLFVGWEGVGLCSYLLIGFWYDTPANAAAGKKAFIANRIGDFGILCGMFLLAHYTGALDWAGIANGAGSLVSPADQMRVHVWPVGGGEYQGIFAFLQPHSPVTISAATAVGLALLLGCTGKSAQIPLYVWLPDAMAGPTPVSALIHAATMVTAGVYLICRLSFIFVLSPFVMMTIAIVGVTTALLAASIALVQNDIKRVLAYSTVSQLGFMFLGVGVGAFTAGFFHVFTHAFFKACLFLGAGSVIHAMHARVHGDKSQDMREMGGLRKYMPFTYWTFVASTLAIAGFPLTSGFFSKDEILYRAWVDHTVNPFTSALMHRPVPVGVYEPPMWIGPILYVAGILAATMTAFYMFRAVFMTFWGDFRGWKIGRPSLLERSELVAASGGAGHLDVHHGDEEEDEHHHEEDLSAPGYPPHESPWQMTIPLIVLATCAIVGGILNMGIFKITPMDHWLEPVFETATSGAVKIKEGGEKLEWPLALGGVAAFVIGSYLAYWMYILQKGAPAKQLAERSPGLYRLLLNKWKVDELYEATVLAAVDALADTSAAFDSWVVDGIVAKLTALVVSLAGSILRAFQNGVVHVYATMMVIGLAAFGWFFVAPHAAASVDASAEANGDYVVTASPGMGYSYRWDSDHDGKHDNDPFTANSQVKLHLEEGKSQSVHLEVVNAFGLRGSTDVPLFRPSTPKPMQLGQN